MRIDELGFPHPAALFRSDGSSTVAVIRRATPVGAGAGWARVIEPALGLDLGYLYIEYHSGDAVVYAVEADATVEPPREAFRDPRLTPRGEFFEMADVDEARRAAAAMAEKVSAENAEVRDETFVVAGRTDDGAWSVTVSPTLPSGTQLVMRGAAGTIRTLTTSAPRADLERGRTEPVRIEATELVGRAWFDPRVGRRPRIVELTLGPWDADA